jgi:DNA-binding GntR family transcriptional regulator
MNETSNIIERDILFGRLRPRERLIEDELIARLQVSRHQVRQALVELERRGLVVRLQNRGAHVRDFAEDDIQKIGDVREMLHAQAVSMMPLPAPEGLAETLAALQERHEAAVDAGDLMAIHEANNAFHSALFEACGNSYLAQTIAEYARLSLAYRCHLMAMPAFAARAAQEHREMIEAITNSDRDRLRKLCIEHTRPAQQVYGALRGWPALQSRSDQIVGGPRQSGAAE